MWCAAVVFARIRLGNSITDRPRKLIPKSELFWLKKNPVFVLLGVCVDICVNYILRVLTLGKDKASVCLLAPKTEERPISQIRPL